VVGDKADDSEAKPYLGSPRAEATAIAVVSLIISTSLNCAHLRQI
jgi:hypothetical protein